MSSPFAKDTDEDNDNVRHTPEVRVTKGMYGRLIYRRLIRILLFAVVVLVILYFCFAATWVRVVPTISGAGFVPVKNVTYEGGILPEGSQVLVDVENEQGIKVLDRLEQAFIPSSSAAKVQIIAGPYGELDWQQPNILTVDGEPVGVPYPANSDGSSPIDVEDPFLKDQYVALCISGSCQPGEAVIIDRSHVFGSVLVNEDVDQEVE